MLALNLVKLECAFYGIVNISEVYRPANKEDHGCFDLPRPCYANAMIFSPDGYSYTLICEKDYEFSGVDGRCMAVLDDKGNVTLQWEKLESGCERV